MYIGYIYKITNKINGKSYIGKTNNIIRRWKEHKYGHGGTAILSKAFIKMYDSISKASLSTGINKSAIRNCLYGWSKTAGNYVWKFKEEEINI